MCKMIFAAALLIVALSGAHAGPFDYTLATMSVVPAVVVPPKAVKGALPALPSVSFAVSGVQVGTGAFPTTISIVSTVKVTTASAGETPAKVEALFKTANAALFSSSGSSGVRCSVSAPGTGASTGVTGMKISCTPGKAIKSVFVHQAEAGYSAGVCKDLTSDVTTYVFNVANVPDTVATDGVYSATYNAGASTFGAAIAIPATDIVIPIKNIGSDGILNLDDIEFAALDPSKGSTFNIMAIFSDKVCTAVPLAPTSVGSVPDGTSYQETTVIARGTVLPTGLIGKVAAMPLV